MSNKKLVLVADVQDGIDLAVQALSESCDLATAKTLKEAEDLLVASENGRKFDLVVAGLHFDDSQMIALLEYIRSVDHLDSLVFLPIQAKDAATKSANESLNKMLQMLGARPIVNLTELEPQQSCQLLQQAVQESFAYSVNRGRIDEAPRNEIGSQKERTLRA